MKTILEIMIITLFLHYIQDYQYYTKGILERMKMLLDMFFTLYYCNF